MNARAEYFDNHSQAARWPFTLYHRPIERDLEQTVNRSVRASSSLRVLVFGCGLFHEARLFRRVPELVLVDADDRLEAPLRERLGHAGVTIEIVTTPEALDATLATESLDLIVSKEVIEHLDNVPDYLDVFRRSLKPGGRLWLSTPNYGAPVLPLVESTFLELVARVQGFSRRHIHPNRYSARRLRAELTAAGFHDVDVRVTPLALALCGSARRP
jgi:SAM-dependent methyltransferase